MTTETHFTESGTSPPASTWKKCGHERTPANTANVSPRKPNGQCRVCQQRAHQWTYARYYGSEKGRAKRERYNEKRRGGGKRRTRPCARYTTDEQRRAARARCRWTRLGVDPAFAWVDYLRLLLAQGNRCALCHKPPRKRRLDVDHDHADGAVRGLVHFDCNRLIGYYEAGRLKDDALRERCASYLAAQSTTGSIVGGAIGDGLVVR